MTRFRLWLAWKILPKNFVGLSTMGASCFTPVLTDNGAVAFLWEAEGKCFSAAKHDKQKSLPGRSMCECFICTEVFEAGPNQCPACGSRDISYLEA